MSTHATLKPGDLAKRAYVLLRAVEELEKVRGGITNAYGAEQCNQLLVAAQSLAAEHPETLAPLQYLGRLGYEEGLGAMGTQRLSSQANVLLAQLKGMLRAFVDLHMDPDDKKRLGLV
jgi:hypothetical protein